jgi:lysozyme
MQFTQAALDLIKEFEGFSGAPYVCPAGCMTIGYGHTIRASEAPGAAIDEQQALLLLQRDLIVVSAYIKQMVHVTLNQCQYDALCSLVYNWGCAKFGRSKGLKLLNQGKLKLAAIEFFSKEKGVVNIRGKFCHGLHRRREAELKLWNQG